MEVWRQDAEWWHVQQLADTAFHEAGHAVVAEQYGCTPEATVWWDSGRCIRGGILIGREERIVGLAGPLAEWMWFAEEEGEDEGNVGEAYAELVRMAGQGKISPSDLASMKGYTRNDVGATVRSLRSLWPRVREVAESLFVQAYFTGEGCVGLSCPDYCDYPDPNPLLAEHSIGEILAEWGLAPADAQGCP